MFWSRRRLSTPPPSTRESVPPARRTALDKRVIKGVLPLRAPLAAHRATLPEARRRESRFRESSRAYAAAVASAAPADPHLRMMALDSLRWWLPLPDPDDEAIVQRALQHQDFPYRVIAQTRELAVGGIMLDIGANTGRMSIPRVILGDATAAYCAEPDPLNYQCLVRNVRDNQLGGLVLPDCIAIGSENGVARLERAKSPGGHRIVDAGARARREVVEVEQLTVDAWVDRAGVDLEQLVFVKVDAQGSELHVLRGASRVLARRHVTWQMEIDPQCLAARGVTPGDIYAILRQHFTHFIDLGSNAVGARVRAIDTLEQVLAYLLKSSGARTDVLFFAVDDVTLFPDRPAD
jgi:FkbM family methyltransferase